MTFEEAIESFRDRYICALGVDPADVEEQAAVALAAFPGEVEIRTVTQDGLVRLFLRVPGGRWLSRYAWSPAYVQDLVRRFVAGEATQ